MAKLEVENQTLWDLVNILLESPIELKQSPIELKQHGASNSLKINDFSATLTTKTTNLKRQVNSDTLGQCG